MSESVSTSERIAEQVRYLKTEWRRRVAPADLLADSHLTEIVGAIYRAAVLDCARKADEEADRISRGPRTYEAAFAPKALRAFAARLREEAK